MPRLYCALFVLITCMAAADVTGKWAGVMSLTEGSDEDSQSCYFILKQADRNVTGTAGPDERHQSPITEGKIEGEQLTFAIAMGEGAMSFTLTPAGDRMEGQMKMTRDGETKAAKVVVKRLGS